MANFYYRNKNIMCAKQAKKNIYIVCHSFSMNKMRVKIPRRNCRRRPRKSPYYENRVFQMASFVEQ